MCVTGGDSVVRQCVGCSLHRHKLSSPTDKLYKLRSGTFCSTFHFHKKNVPVKVLTTTRFNSLPFFLSSFMFPSSFLHFPSFFFLTLPLLTFILDPLLLVLLSSHTDPLYKHAHPQCHPRAFTASGRFLRRLLSGAATTRQMACIELHVLTEVRGTCWQFSDYACARRGS